MALIDKLQDSFEHHFGDDDEGLLFEAERSSSGQVTGILTSSIFENMREYQRQNMIWDVLEAELNDEELERITIIIANTPEETAGLDDDKRLGEPRGRAGS